MKKYIYVDKDRVAQNAEARQLNLEFGFDNPLLPPIVIAFDNGRKPIYCWEVVLPARSRVVYDPAHDPADAPHAQVWVETYDEILYQQGITEYFHTLDERAGLIG